MSIDYDKPVQMRNGCEVKIYTTAGQDESCPVVGEYKPTDGIWTGRRWGRDGSYFDNRKSDDDLVNVPQQHTVWVNVYEESLRGWAHESKDKADRSACNLSGSRIACIEVTFTDGEGLE